MLIKCGLGTQLFSYACARSVALKNNTDLFLDISWYDNIPSQLRQREQRRLFERYELHNFNIKGVVINSRVGVFYKEKHFQFDPDVLNVGSDTYLKGTFASWKYFSDFQDEIRTDLVSKKPLSDEAQKVLRMINCQNSVDIHVRRTDFIDSPHDYCNEAYYTKIIDVIMYADLTAYFFIFSDDPLWCEEIFKKYKNRMCIIRHQDSVEDLILRSNCRVHVIPNSAWGWWGAWLDPNPNKIVYCPSKWVKLAGYDSIDVFPPSWIRVDV